MVIGFGLRRRDVSRGQIHQWQAPDRDRYYRWLAVCWRDDGMELNAEMVRLGWALAYRPGSDPFPRPKYERQEAEARAAGRGMWRGTFIPPWEWRHR